MKESRFLIMSEALIWQGDVIEGELLDPLCPKCNCEVRRGERKNPLGMHYDCFLRHNLNRAKAALRRFEKRRGISYR